MHVNLTPTLDEYILTKVKSGRYNNASEVVREALRKMQDSETRESMSLASLTSQEIDGIRNRVGQGLVEVERGEARDYEGQEGLNRFFREIRTEAQREMPAKRRKRDNR